MRKRVKAQLPEPGTDVGGYVLKARLGAGGFGTVYLGERGGQRYALKLVPLEELAPWGERELLMLARVKHPNAVRLLGHWHWPDASPRFLVVIMEYVEGCPLGVWAREQNPSARRVVRAVLGVARALSAVHAAKAMHRDVKEANIVLRAADGEAVLVDFGVGTYEGTSGLGAGTLPPGTRAYLSPEAWRFHRAHAGQKDAHFTSTPACDVWALGVVLYWLLVDRRPFDVTEKAGVDALLTQAPVAPHAVNPRVPPELGELCLRLLEKAPEARPDAGAVCSALEALLERGETAWDTPLCEFHGVHNTTTLPGPDADEEVMWRKAGEGREDLPPRRGPRPPRRAEDSDASAAPPAPVASPLAPGPPAGVKPPFPPPVPGALAPAVPVAVGARLRARWHWGAVGLLLLVGLGLAVARLRGEEGFARPATLQAPASSATGNTDEVFEVEAGTGEGWKVAPPWKPPEADRAVARPAPASTPAATASRAVTSEEAAPVKTPAKQPRPSVPGPGATFKSAGAAACLALSGCASTPVVYPPLPSAEPCPPRAVETMKSLGIDVGDTSDTITWHMTDKDASYITLHEGWTSVLLTEDFGKLPQNTVLSGRLILSDPVQVRFVQANVQGQRPVPVCMVAFNLKATPQPDKGPTAVRVFSSADVEAVDRFE